MPRDLTLPDNNMSSEASNLKPVPDTPKSDDSHRRSRRRSRGNYRSEKKIRLLKIVLGSCLIAYFLTVAFTWMSMARTGNEMEEQTMQLRKQGKTIAETKAELQEVTTERDALVADRIPGLIPLDYDAAIAIDDQYIRNIIFTLVSNGRERHYEYRMVMHNNTLSIIKPKVEILLFDDVGIQVGRAVVEKSNATTEVDRADLDPGEVRSYSSSIDLFRIEEPRYFLLSIKEAPIPASEALREHLENVVEH